MSLFWKRASRQLSRPVQAGLQSACDWEMKKVKTCYSTFSFCFCQLDSFMFTNRNVTRQRAEWRHITLTCLVIRWSCINTLTWWNDVLESMPNKRWKSACMKPSQRERPKRNEYIEKKKKYRKNRRNQIADYQTVPRPAISPTDISPNWHYSDGQFPTQTFTRTFPRLLRLMVLLHCLIYSYQKQLFIRTILQCIYCHRKFGTTNLDICHYFISKLNR